VPGGGTQQGWAEIQAGVGAAEATPGELARQLTIPAAQVEEPGIPGDALQDGPHAGLQALARGGKLRG